MTEYSENDQRALKILFRNLEHALEMERMWRDRSFEITQTIFAIKERYYDPERIYL